MESESDADYGLAKSEQLGPPSPAWYKRALFPCMPFRTPCPGGRQLVCPAMAQGTPSVRISDVDELPS